MMRPVPVHWKAVVFLFALVLTGCETDDSRPGVLLDRPDRIDPYDLSQGRAMPDKTDQAEEAAADDDAPSSAARIAITPDKSRSVIEQTRIFRSAGTPEGGAPSYSLTPTADGDMDVTISLDGVTVGEAARVILQGVLQENYSLEAESEATVTIMTAAPVSRESVVSIFGSALDSIGLALVRSDDIVVSGDGLWRIVPTAQARGAAGFDVLGEGRPLPLGYATVAVPLRFVSASNIAALLEPIAPSGVLLQTDDSRSLIILGGAQGDLQVLLEAISVFDANLLANRSSALVPVRFARASELAREVELALGLREGAPVASLVRLVPNDRLNAILVVSQQDNYLNEALSWIDRLDLPSDSGEELLIYNVQNRSAESLAAALTPIFAAETQTATSPGETIASGAPQAASAAPQVPAPLPRPVPAQPAGTGAAPGQVRINVDAQRNALIILAPADRLRLVRQVAEQLDTTPSQVMFEARIVEVTLTDALSYGVRWFLESGDVSFTFTDLASGAVTPLFPSFSAIFDTADVSVALSALDSVTDVKVVSSPTLVVLDNSMATLQIGDQVPVIVRNVQSIQDPEAPIIQDIELRDTGILLGLTPRVNDSGLIVMDISQEASSVVPTVTSGIDSPTIRQRLIRTQVAVTEGQTLLLGGLIQEETSDTEVGIPVVSSIPVLGNLFKTVDETANRTELIILVTPRVLRSGNDARDAIREFRNRLRWIKLGEE